MKLRLSAATRISIGLVFLTVSVVLAAHAIGLLPTRTAAILDGRRKLCEMIAVQCSLAARNNDLATVRTIVQAAVQRNEDMVSAAVRSAEGALLAEAGGHPEPRAGPGGAASAPARARVPIYKGDAEWGTVEVCFRPIHPPGVLGVVGHPLVLLLLFVAGLGLVCYRLFLRKTLQHLDPSQVIPERVRATLDALAEGVLVLDRKERIVLANAAFAETVGQSPSSLMGRRASGLNWQRPEPDETAGGRPWLDAMADGRPRTGARLALATRGRGVRTFMVNSAPILGGDGARRGALATFDDITEIEERNSRLREMLKLLKRSRDEVNRQNQELQFFATRDPLTGCVNRRSFLEALENAWSAAKRYGYPLACVMVDVDRFKSVNDRHGHAVGDEVLQRLAGTLREQARRSDLICRYGGEEFCILLPHTDVGKAADAAERFRRAIQAQDGAAAGVTASFGVSATSLGAETPQALLDQADKALYMAKRSGRNCAARWDALPEAPPAGPEDTPYPEPRRQEAADVPVPLHAVNALTSALAHRDITTAEHSRQVADLCALTARGLMSPSECFLVEMAGLLHDIGKLGVPDSILLKPGPLTEQEWRVMRTHEHMGVEIIASAFSSPRLTEIVRSHHARYAGNAGDPGMPAGQDIPLGARILAIADAFSAMVSDRPYRRARTHDEAFQELRRCAGTQFDPALVERFIEAVAAHSRDGAAAGKGFCDAAMLGMGKAAERLARAVDRCDISLAEAIAGRLAITAAKHGAPRIAQLAGELAGIAGCDDPDPLRIVQLTTGLLNLCRAERTAAPAGAPAR